MNPSSATFLTFGCINVIIISLYLLNQNNITAYPNNLLILLNPRLNLFLMVLL